MPSSRPKVLVAMSGGVDSSVAAALLLEQGYEVVGCFMRLGSPGETFDELERYDHGDGTNGANGAGGADGAGGAHGAGGCGGPTLKIGHQGCCSINDAADARLVAARLGIPFYVCNFKKEFGRIIDYFVGEYNAGRTPNPCVRCNDWLKFGRLHAYARQIDAAFVASGHYARIETGAGGSGPRLLRGVDRDKDQSYVLFGAPRERLAEMLLPIGGLEKSRVRAIAKGLDLPVFDKPDSQEICFVPDNDYAGLVRRKSPDAFAAGRILDRDGGEIGTHDGHQHFTIGQRRGIGVAAGLPLYVIQKDAAANTITVGPREDLAVKYATAHETNWLVDPPQGWTACTAKIRYNAQPVPARVRATTADTLEVEFAKPQDAVAPGQALVCYDGDRVMGGGWIR